MDYIRSAHSINEAAALYTHVHVVCTAPNSGPRRAISPPGLLSGLLGSLRGVLVLRSILAGADQVTLGVGLGPLKPLGPLGVGEH